MIPRQFKSLLHFDLKIKPRIPSCLTVIPSRRYTIFSVYATTEMRCWTFLPKSGYISWTWICTAVSPAWSSRASEARGWRAGGQAVRSVQRTGTKSQSITGCMIITPKAPRSLSVDSVTRGRLSELPIGPDCSPAQGAWIHLYWRVGCAACQWVTVWGSVIRGSSASLFRVDE